MQDSFDFKRYVYTGNALLRGMAFEEVLERPNLDGYTALVAGIDTGFVDPTIVSVMGRTDSGQWRMLIRYELRQVDFPLQEKIIAWLDSFYHFDRIGLDMGAGGGGTQMFHSFIYRPEHTAAKMVERLVPVSFQERIAVGYNTDGKELTQTTKTLGATLLIQQLQQKTIALSEIDQECVSEMERITKQRTTAGDDRYFILSEKGNGASPNDHIFASLVCFTIATRDMSFMKRKKKKLGKSSGKF